jgi:hypothetical protein
MILFPNPTSKYEDPGLYNRSQSGVTLLLAILILSAIAAISFSIATILNIELRSSGDLARTEPAWYAAGARSEEHLFQIRRKVGEDSFPFTTAINNLTLTGSSSALTDPIQQDRVLSGSASFSTARNRYRIYNPDTSSGHNPFTDPSGYGKVEVTYLNTGAGGQIHIYLCQYNPTTSYDCSNPSNGTYMIYQDTTPLNEGGTILLDGAYGFDPNKQQELIIYGSGTSDRYVQIKSWDSVGTPKGLPYFGITAVDIDAQGAAVTRSIRVRIPNN